MITVSTTYAKIAAALREQKLPDTPVDYQREELLYRLSKMDDPAMREYGIRELNSIIARRHGHTSN